MNEEQIGKVRFFDVAKGWGFVEVDGEEADVFVHYKQIKMEGDGFKKLSQGQTVSFFLEQGDKGPYAVDVRVVA